MDWKPLPDGTRVKHRSKDYEGWVDGLSKLENPGQRNPDGSRYRIRVHNRPMRELAAETDIECCKDFESIFRPGASLLQKTIDKRSSDRKQNELWRAWNAMLPLPCTIWAAGEYHPNRAYAAGSNLVSRGNHTEQILNLKKIALPTSVDYFVEELEQILAKGFPICMVPSSLPSATNDGLREVIRRLAQNGRVDASSVLVRHQPVVPSQSAS